MTSSERTIRMRPPSSPDDTDPGAPAPRCATCQTKIEEISVRTPDGRLVCSRKCAVHGVTLPRGTPDEPTLRLRISETKSIAWEPKAWVIGLRWDRYFVHLYAPMVRVTFERPHLVRHMQRPYVWLPLSLLSVLVFGVWLGVHWRSEPIPLNARTPASASVPNAITAASSELSLSASAYPAGEVLAAPPASASAAIVPVASTTTTTVASPITSATTTTTTTVAPRPLAKTKVGIDCSTPFTVDATGVRRPRSECFEVPARNPYDPPPTREGSVPPLARDRY